VVQKKPVIPQKTMAAQKRAAAARPTTRAGRQVARHSGREEVGSRLALMIGGGLALLVLLLIGIGYYSTYIGPARDTAIRVGNHDISLGEYRDRLRAATLASDPNATQADAFNKESSTTELLETEQIYLQRAQTLGISADDDAIAVSMATGVHVPTKDNQIVDIATYETILRNELQRQGLSLDQERNAARASVLKNNVLQKFRADVPKQALAVKATELVFTSRQQGQAAQQRLGNGDSVSDIAQDTVGDPSIGHAQPFDWTPTGFGILPASLDEVATKLNPGEVSDLIQITPTAGSTAPQWYLLAITDRDPNHDVNDTQALQIGNAKVSTWLDQQKQLLGLHSFVDGAKATWAAVHSGLPETARATPTPVSVPARAPGAPGAPPSVPQPLVPGAGPSQPGVPAPPGGAAPAGPPAPSGNPPVPNGTP
jgi:hypothetical protein